LLDQWPRKLALFGGSGHGLALAQAFRRLGSEVHLFDSGLFLPGEDRELVAPVLARLRRDGVQLHEETSVARIEPNGDGLFLEIGGRGSAQRIEANHLVMTEQPVPRVEGIGLKEAGVRYDAGGIKVRTDLRTSNPRIYAIGDALGGVHTHARARYQAQQAVAQIFDASSRPSAQAPRIVFTEPELAAVGLTEEEAQANGREIRVLRAPFHDNVAAQTAGESEGHVKLITDGRDHLIGAGIVGPRARELIGLYGFAISLELRAADLKGFVPASPSLTEVGRLAVLASPAQFGKRLWRRVFPISRRRS
jgi:pyruvate/2-oxoglutarate dehydrogenase complex dihydrolipoamide dehydrogenase (E3) component